MKYLKLFEEAKIRWYNKGKWLIEPQEEIEESRDIIYDKDFTDFLIDHGAYENYMIAVEKRGKLDQVNNKWYKKLDLIDGPVFWVDTEQGLNYWSDMNKKWIKFCRNLQ